MRTAFARHFLAGIIVLMFAFLAACSGKAPVEQKEPPALTLPEGCSKAHVFAPGNYIADVEGGAVVTLHPEVQTFPLFCSPDGARSFAAMLVANGDLPGGDWQVYRLEGNFSDLAEQVGQNEYILRVKARISEWVPDKLEQTRPRARKNDPAKPKAKLENRKQTKEADKSGSKADVQDKTAEKQQAQ